MKYRRRIFLKFKSKIIKHLKPIDINFDSNAQLLTSLSQDCRKLNVKILQLLLWQ